MQELLSEPPFVQGTLSDDVTGFDEYTVVYQLEIPDEAQYNNGPIPYSVDSSSSSSVLPTNMPEEIKVFESNGIPISIAVPSRNKAIGMTSIPTSVRPVDMWKIDLWWMPVPVKRVYYVLQTDALSLITVFKDLCESSPVNVSGSRWYRQNY